MKKIKIITLIAFIIVLGLLCYKLYRNWDFSYQQDNTISIIVYSILSAIIFVFYLLIHKFKAKQKEPQFQVEDKEDKPKYTRQSTFQYLIPIGEEINKAPKYTSGKSLADHAKEIDDYYKRLKELDDKRKELAKDNKEYRIAPKDFVQEAVKIHNEKTDIEKKLKETPLFKDYDGDLTKFAKAVSEQNKLIADEKAAKIKAWKEGKEPVKPQLKDYVGKKTALYDADMKEYKADMEEYEKTKQVEKNYIWKIWKDKEIKCNEPILDKTKSFTKIKNTAMKSNSTFKTIIICITVIVCVSIGSYAYYESNRYKMIGLYRVDIYTGEVIDLRPTGFR
jgi:uncharacterized membrane protein